MGKWGRGQAEGILETGRKGIDRGAKVDKLWQWGT